MNISAVRSDFHLAVEVADQLTQKHKIPFVVSAANYGNWYDIRTEYIAKPCTHLFNELVNVSLADPDERGVRPSSNVPELLHVSLLKLPCIIDKARTLHRYLSLVSGLVNYKQPEVLDMYFYSTTKYQQYNQKIPILPQKYKLFPFGEAPSIPCIEEFRNQLDHDEEEKEE